MSNFLISSLCTVQSVNRQISILVNFVLTVLGAFTFAYFAAYVCSWDPVWVSCIRSSYKTVHYLTFGRPNTQKYCFLITITNHAQVDQQSFTAVNSGIC